MANVQASISAAAASPSSTSPVSATASSSRLAKPTAPHVTPTKSTSNQLHVPAQRGGAAAQRRKSQPTAVSVQPLNDSTGLQDLPASASVASSTSVVRAAHSEAQDEAAPTLRTGESSKTLLAAQRAQLGKSYATAKRRKSGEMERTSTRASSINEETPSLSEKARMAGWSKEDGTVGEATESGDASSLNQRPSSLRTPSFISTSSLATPSTPDAPDVAPLTLPLSTSASLNAMPLTPSATRRASSSGSVTSRTSAGTRIQFSPSVRIANAAPPSARHKKPPAVLGGNIALGGGWGVGRNVLAEVRAKEEEERRARKLEERQEALSKGSAGRGGAGNRRAASSGSGAGARPKTAPAASERKPFGFAGGGVRALVSGRWKSSNPIRADAEEQRRLQADKEEEEDNRDVFAPIHPNGPFGAPLPDGAHQGPALNATIVQDLPAPPRAFYPGTLILIRSPSQEEVVDGSEDERESLASEEAVLTTEPVDLDSLASTSKHTSTTHLEASHVVVPDLSSSHSHSSTTTLSSALTPSQARSVALPSDTSDFQLAPDEHGRVLWAGPPHEPEAHAEYADSIASLPRGSSVRRRFSKLLVAKRPKEEVGVLRNEEGDEAEMAAEEKKKFWRRRSTGGKGRHARSATLAAPEHAAAEASAQAQAQAHSPTPTAKQPFGWSLLRRTSTHERRASSSVLPTSPAPPPRLPSTPTPTRARIITSREVDAMPPILFRRLEPATPSPIPASTPSSGRRARPGTADAVMQRQPFLTQQQMMGEEVVLQKRGTPWDLELSALREVRGRAARVEKSAVAAAAG